ncbi:hypothetical protein [Ramlibacter sp.]|uniref:hypothetical protein n=1 Tax=Ramlibacter sp. TaxID=1917967 RepID=UPI002D3A221C|nr:hypothetical protein [Ramlibacter sp.]HYD74511.1 hypothetical protein [Ramlibacter sp.]
MPLVLSFLARLLALAAGLVLAASLLAAGLVAVAFLLLKAGWARLTGKPVPPILSAVWRMRGFAAAQRFRTAASTRPAPGFEPRRVRVPVDVTDVEPK